MTAGAPSRSCTSAPAAPGARSGTPRRPPSGAACAPGLPARVAARRPARLRRLAGRHPFQDAVVAARAQEWFRTVAEGGKRLGIARHRHPVASMCWIALKASRRSVVVRRPSLDGGGSSGAITARSSSTGRFHVAPTCAMLLAGGLVPGRCVLLVWFVADRDLPHLGEAIHILGQALRLQISATACARDRDQHCQGRSSIRIRGASRWRSRRLIGVIGRKPVLPVSPWLKASAIGKIARKFQQIIPVVGSTQVNGHMNVRVVGVFLRGRASDCAFRRIHIGGSQGIPAFQ